MVERAPDDRQPRNVVDRATRSAIRGESTAFGFSIMITVTFGAIQRRHGTPGIADLLGFALCAVAAFTVLEGIVSRGFSQALPEHRSNVATFGTALNFLSVGLAAASAIGLSAVIGTDAAWLICPVVAVVTYLTAESAELVAAERIQRARGNRRAADVRG